jgi:hypothetical protein
MISILFFVHLLENKNNTGQVPAFVGVITRKKLHLLRFIPI